MTTPNGQSVSQAAHSTAQHSTAQHSTAQHSTAQHSTAQQPHVIGTHTRTHHHTHTSKTHTHANTHTRTHHHTYTHAHTHTHTQSRSSHIVIDSVANHTEELISLTRLGGVRHRSRRRHILHAQLVAASERRNRGTHEKRQRDETTHEKRQRDETEEHTRCDREMKQTNTRTANNFSER